MEMSLQNIYYIVGVAGLALAAICALAAIVYFVRADIRGVLADLSGKTRQAELASFTVSRGRRGAKRNALSQGEWEGNVSHGDLAAESGGTAAESGGQAVSGGYPQPASMGSNADLGYNNGAIATGGSLASDYALTEVGRGSSAGGYAVPEAGMGNQSQAAFVAPASEAKPAVVGPIVGQVSQPGGVSTQVASVSTNATGSFVVIQQVALAYADRVIDSQGNEVPLYVGGNQGSGWSS